jgi:hypothetical protein
MPSSLLSFAKRVFGHVSVPISPSPMFDRPGGKWSIASHAEWKECADGLSLRFYRLHAMNWCSRAMRILIDRQWLTARGRIGCDGPLAAKQPENVRLSLNELQHL